ncbi:hypothetical protein EYF80_045054 [Liparis tanakae]|uniref:Uncharacterized protein n=1 Tax=Liparis tanakae TaxID=230148 RepID=A0A4Z2FVZ6_9TELE|nr:hypothetical protein EYF80_045054 [Liparis tanakae]
MGGKVRLSEEETRRGGRKGSDCQGIKQGGTASDEVETGEWSKHSGPERDSESYADASRQAT